MGAVMQSAQLGLEIGSVLGHAFLIPYKNKAQQYEAQLITGWKGLLALARRSGNLKSLSAHVVYEKDEFDYGYGDEEYITHKPSKDPEPGKITFVYCVAHLSDGGTVREVMRRDEIDAIRNRGRANPVWQSDFPEMARKTVVRRICKYLDLSPEVQDALAVDAEYEIPRDEVNPDKYKALIADEEPSMSAIEQERNVAVLTLRRAMEGKHYPTVLGVEMDEVFTKWTTEQLFDAADKVLNK